MAKNDDLTRHEVLEQVNKVLVRYGLPLWEHVKRLGRRSKAEIEVVGVSAVSHHIEGHNVHIVFNVLEPGSDQVRGYGVRFNTRPGIIAIIRINGEFLFVDQWRFAIGVRPLEALRGWVAEEVINAPPADQVVNLIGRKCGEEFADSLTPISCHHIGSLYEDTSTRGDIVDVYFLDAKTDRAPPNRHALWRPRLFTYEEMLEEERIGRLAVDLQSSAALRRFHIFNSHSVPDAE